MTYRLEIHIELKYRLSEYMVLFFCDSFPFSITEVLIFIGFQAFLEGNHHINGEQTLR